MIEPAGTSSPAAFRLTLPCDLAEVPLAVSAVHNFLAQQGCAEEDVLDCELALAEASNNAIRYAPQKAREQPVLIDVACGPTEVELRVTDHTLGFDWPQQPTLPGPESESGRGVFLICSVMTYASYLRSAGENTLVLRRTRSGA